MNKNVWLVSGAYIAALVGGGFASGQEILSFFVKYGRASFVAVAVVCVLLGLFGALILEGTASRGTYTFSEYLKGILPEPIYPAASVLVTLFMLAVFAVMISAGGETISAIWGGTPAAWGVLLCLVCLAAMRGGLRMLTAVNGLLGLFIGVGVLVACWYIVNYRFAGTFAGGNSLAASGISYTGYNMISAGVALAGMGRFIKNGREAALAGVISGTVMFLMMAGVWTVISIFYGKIPLGEIPMLTIASRQGKGFAFLYMVLLGVSIYTTAAACASSAMNELRKRTTKTAAMAAVACCGVIGGGFPFSGMVDILYRAAGYAGAVILMYIAIDYVKKIKKVRKTKINRKN